MKPADMVRVALAGHPYPVRYERNWNRLWIAGRGTWAPRWVMLHHTAGTHSLGVLMKTRWLPVRGAHFLIDRDGTVHVLSARKAYHAGTGGPRWGVARNAMNAFAWGIEIEDLGLTQSMTDEQIESAALLSGGLLEAMGQGLDHLIQHKEWNTTGKVDTRYSTGFWREKVEATMAAIEGYRDYTGKVRGKVAAVVDDDWHDVPGLRALKGSPFRQPDEIHSLYCRIYPTWGPESTPLSVQFRWVRDNGDATGHEEGQFEVGPGMNSIPLRVLHDEIGAMGVGGRWQYRLKGDGVEVQFGTRYGKLRALNVRWTVG